MAKEAATLEDMRCKLIGIDVDGTLVGTSNEVSAQTWQALEAAKAAGLELAICSGRPAVGHALSYARRLKSPWHIFQNGASIVNVMTNESISCGFPDDVLTKLLSLAHEKHWLLEVYSDLDMSQTKPDEIARRHAELLGISFEAKQPAILSGTAVRAQWVVPHAYAEEAISLTRSLGDLDLHPATTPAMSEMTFISVTRAGVNKGSALALVAERYGISLEQTMAVGDGENDLYALKTAGWSVAMGNADPMLKEIARVVVGHVDEGGLCEAIALALSEESSSYPH